MSVTVAHHEIRCVTRPTNVNEPSNWDRTSMYRLKNSIDLYLEIIISERLESVLILCDKNPASASSHIATC